MSTPKHERREPTLGYESAQRDIREGLSYSAPAYGVPEKGQVEWVNDVQNPFDPMGLGHRRATPLMSHDGGREEATFEDERGFYFRPRFDGV